MGTRALWGSQLTLVSDGSSFAGAGWCNVIAGVLLLTITRLTVINTVCFMFVDSAALYGQTTENPFRMTL